MRMALCTTHGQPHPDLHRRVDSIFHCRDPELLIIGPALIIFQGIAVKSCGKNLISAGLRKKIPSQLLLRELVKGHILIEGIDNPIPVSPDVARSVLFVAFGVRIPGKIQPHPGPMLPKTFGLQQIIHQGLVVPSLHESIHHLDFRRQTREIEGNPPGQSISVCLFGKTKPLRLQPFSYKVVHRMLLSRHFRLSRGNKRPMHIIGSSSCDPLPQKLLLFLCQHMPSVRWRHQVIRIIRFNPVNQFTVINRPQRFLRPCRSVQTKFPLPRIFIRTMAGKTVCRQDGANITIEIDCGFSISQRDHLGSQDEDAGQKGFFHGLRVCHKEGTLSCTGKFYLCKNHA